jgi:hypothetical protein
MQSDPFGAVMELQLRRTATLNDPPIGRWNGATPMLMTMVVLAMIVHDLYKYGFHARHHDEGTADHIAMILMYGQIPIVVSFVVSGWHEFRRIAPVLGTQVSLWLLTFAAAYL